MALSPGWVPGILFLPMFRSLRLGCLAIKNQVVACLRGLSLGAWLGGLGIGVLLVALRWNSLDVPLVRDEGEYAYAAQLLKCGRLPYEHSFLQKPPMVVYTYALASALAPNTFWFPRVLAGLFAALAACLLGLIARLEFGRGFALPAMWLCTPMLLCPSLWQFTANTEMFMILPLLATVAVYVVSRHRGSACCYCQQAAADGTPAVMVRSGRGAWFLAGGLGATALWYKYTALPVLAMVFVVWSIEEWRAGSGGRRLLRWWLFGILGAGVTSALELAPFLARDGGRRLWECTVVFNRFYRASASFGMSGFWGWLEAFWVDWWILFLLPGVLLVRHKRRVWFWMGLFVAAWVSTGASAFGQYYVVVMPFWALLAAVAINELAEWAAASPFWSQAWLRRAFTAVVVLLVCLPDLPWVACAKQEFATVKARGNPFLESQAVARRVAELTSPNDYVFVAGSEPQILFYANRLSPTRFVIVYPLMISTPLAQSYQQEAIRDLERRPPAVIVLARSPLSWLPQKQSPLKFINFLEKLLADHYDPVGGWVVEGQSGRWQEPLPDRDQANASLVLFRRKGS